MENEFANTENSASLLKDYYPQTLSESLAKKRKKLAESLGVSSATTNEGNDNDQG